MPTALLGGQVGPALHDEGLRSHEAFALPGEPPPSRMVIGPTGLGLTISGVTRDAAGAALASCAVHLFETLSDQEIWQTTSDASGAFALRFAYPEYTYYLVAYLAGSPDVAGTTVNTLTGS